MSPFRILLLRFAIVPTLAVYGLVLFLIAGTTALPMVWAYLIVATVVGVASMFAVDADLLRERLRPGPGGKDRAAVQGMKWLMLAHLLLAVVDLGRLHWTDSVPFAFQVVCLVGFAAGMAFAVWAMLVNPFFSSVVRLQTDRGHRLITDGPYAWVRHPGYAGVVLSMLCSGPALGSWISMLPALLCVALIMRRLMIEDRFLFEELEGYRDYAATTTSRLFPGIW